MNSCIHRAMRGFFSRLDLRSIILRRISVLHDRNSGLRDSGAIVGQGGQQELKRTKGHWRSRVSEASPQIWAALLNASFCVSLLLVRVEQMSSFFLCYKPANHIIQTILEEKIVQSFYCSRYLDLCNSLIVYEGFLYDYSIIYWYMCFICKCIHCISLQAVSSFNHVPNWISQKLSNFWMTKLAAESTNAHVAAFQFLSALGSVKLE